MSDHLPECFDAMIPDFHNERWVCICPALRACEKRVLSGPMSMPSYLDGRKRGYAAGVQAARDAVAGVGVRKDTSHDMRVQALAAIDALRGSGNPHTPPSAEKGEQA